MEWRPKGLGLIFEELSDNDAAFARGGPMQACRLTLTFTFLLVVAPLWSQEVHEHGVPEKLGTVSFPVSCESSVQQNFNRSVALLHSFAYSAAQAAFEDIARMDPGCAMAHWGIAMSLFHQLWEPHLKPESIAIGEREIRLAQRQSAVSEREKQFIDALAFLFDDADQIPYSARSNKYEQAMGRLAAENNQDLEAQVFYALALLSNASPTDKSHTKQKRALALLEPLGRAHPDHPGILHYEIHACDNAELAQRGLGPARTYSHVAPSAPHALHMPSHIFTRLGLWQDSIASNLSARDAARHQGDTGEELHAMDYLMYAYLQLGRYDEAKQLLAQLNSMAALNEHDFKIIYAATAMPVRYAVERHQWAEVTRLAPPQDAPPYVTALAVWARGIALTWGENNSAIDVETDQLQKLENRLQEAHDDYWAVQVQILRRELMAWAAQAKGREQEASGLLRDIADQEDSIEKLPVTPGPVIPAREQLGYMLLLQHHPTEAAREFRTALREAPGRRGSIEGLASASTPAGQKKSGSILRTIPTVPESAAPRTADR
jgi:tetratricopeptide (TPR) repeat protein